MKQLLVVPFLILSLSLSAQKEIFRSGEKFTETQLENFYSSVTLLDSMVYFKANDYTLYAYNKNQHQLAWKYYLKYKSNSRVYHAANYLWMNTGETDGLRLNLDGTNPKTLAFSIYSEPIVKNNMLYATGIFEAGNVFAYDLAADSIAWFRFIAHGCDTRPYYLEDKIIANAEGQNWMEMDYAGKLSKDCKEEEGYDFPSGKDCISEYAFLTHDQKTVSVGELEKLGLDVYGSRDVVTTGSHTIVLEEGRLVILGSKKKKYFSMPLYELAEEIEDNSYAYSKILRADKETVWLSYDDKLLKFDIKSKSIKQVIDLKAWNPHQVVLDGNVVWLISSENGLLYALSV